LLRCLLSRAPSRKEVIMMCSIFWTGKGEVRIDCRNCETQRSHKPSSLSSSSSSSSQFCVIMPDPHPTKFQVPKVSYFCRRTLNYFSKWAFTTWSHACYMTFPVICVLLIITLFKLPMLFPF
jgi:hypothetical protein